MWSKKQILWICGIFSLFVWTVFSAPFNRNFTFKQADGSSITIYGRGDEFYAEFFDRGFPVMMNPKTKNYEYAILRPDQSGFDPSGVAVGTKNPETIPGLKKNARVSADARQKIIQARKKQLDPGNSQLRRWNELKKRAIRRKNASGQIGMLGVDKYPETVGEIRGLTILVDFPDQPGHIPVEEVEQYLNGDDYHGYGNHGSVKKYFADVSNGRLDYQNILIPYVRVPHPKSFYDNNEAVGAGITLLHDICSVLIARPDYETEIRPLLDQASKAGNGCFLALNIFYAGTCACGWTKGLWPSSWGLGFADPSFFPGYHVDRLMITDMQNELSIGTFCHENGHMVCGYPDLYDYDYDSAGGAGSFCLMAAGNNLGNGKNPCQVCAFLKYVSGWVDPIKLDYTSYIEDATLTADPNAENFNSVYLFERPDNNHEFFIIENRNRSWRDQFIPSSGLAIWHVDLEGNGNDQRYEFNDEHHNYECCLMQADGLWDLNNNRNAGDAIDLFYKGNTAKAYKGKFTKSTNPSSKWWDGTDSHLNILNISEPGLDMTFRIAPDNLAILTSKIPVGRVGSPYYAKIVGTNSSVKVSLRIEDGVVLPDGLTFDETGLMTGMPTSTYSNDFKVICSCFEGALAVTNHFTLQILPKFDMPFEDPFNDPDRLSAGGWTLDSHTNSVKWVFKDGNSFELLDSNQGYPKYAFSAPKNALYKTTEKTLRGAKQKLVSPLMSFEKMPHSVELSFQLCMHKNNELKDALTVYYKTSWDAEWTVLKEYTKSIAKWTEQKLTIPELSQTYYFAFEATANGGSGVHIDDVKFCDPTPPLAFDANTLPQINIGEPYVYTNLCQGGIGPYTQTLKSGSLPDGITFDNGVFSGTIGESAIGDYQIELTVTDSIGNEITQDFTFEVNYPRVTLFRENFEKIFGVMPPKGWTENLVSSNIHWKVQTINDGILEGYPNPIYPKEGDYHAIFWFLNDESSEKEVIYPGLTTELITPVIPLGYIKNKPRLAFWLENEPFGIHQDELRVYYRTSQSNPWKLLATYTEPVVGWEEEIIDLPEPTQSYQIAFAATTRRGNGVHLDDIRISVASPAPVLVNSPVLPDAWQGQVYKTQLTAFGGTGENQWTATGLPDGLTLDPTTGVISGVPGAGTKGSHSIQITITDQKGVSQSYDVSLYVIGGRKVPFVENFDGTEGALPSGWSTSTNNYKISWNVTKGGATYNDYKPNPRKAFSPNWNLSCGAPGADKNTSKLFLPMISFPEGCSNAVMTFKIAKPYRKNYNNITWKDKFKISYMTNSLSSKWNDIETFSTNIQDWVTVSIPLPNPSDNYFIQFAAALDGGYGISIDDLTITAEGGKASNNHAGWVDQYFPDGYPGDETDSDGDGIPNILEFVYGTDPTNAVDGEICGLVGSVQGDVFTGTYRESKEAIEDGYTLQLEGCTNLVEGTWSTDYISEEASSPIDQGSWWQIIKRSDFLTSERPMQFLRLRLIYPED